MIYQKIIRPLLFKTDPERIHDKAIQLGELFGRFSLTRTVTKFLFSYQHPYLKQTVDGIIYQNPLGLAAGFDKDAKMTTIISSLGFGFEEIGTVTGEPCPGNQKPRLWRIPEQKSLRVYYGLKNDGCEAIAKRLKKVNNPLGISIGKTNCWETVDVEKGIADYYKTLFVLEPFADYLTINISCPNAFGGEPFNSPELLERLLKKLDTIKTTKPVYLKLTPDLNEGQIDDLLEVAKRHRVQGFVISNLTKKNSEKGGLSGLPVKEISTMMISYVYQKTAGKYTIIGCGGVFTGKDAYEKIKAGASLIQLITGMIYEGPGVIKKINQELVQLLKKDGFVNISEAIGSKI